MAWSSSSGCGDVSACDASRRAQCCSAAGSGAADGCAGSGVGGAAAGAGGAVGACAARPPLAAAGRARLRRTIKIESRRFSGEYGSSLFNSCESACACTAVMRPFGTPLSSRTRRASFARSNDRSQLLFLAEASNGRPSVWPWISSLFFMREKSGASFSSTARPAPIASPITIAVLLESCSVPRPPENARETPAQTTHDGAGQASPPSTRTTSGGRSAARASGCWSPRSTPAR